MTMPTLERQKQLAVDTLELVGGLLRRGYKGSEALAVFMTASILLLQQADAADDEFERFIAEFRNAWRNR